MTSKGGRRRHPTSNIRYQSQQLPFMEAAYLISHLQVATGLTAEGLTLHAAQPRDDLEMRDER